MRLAGRPDLSAVLRGQDAVITRRQALEVGLARSTIDGRLGPGGPWRRLVPGVYLTVTGTPTADQREIAALLHAGPVSTLTGPAALRRHGMRAPQTATVDVLVPAGCRRQSISYIAVHRTRRMPEFVYYSGPISYVPQARAVADTGRGLADLGEVRAVVAAAAQSRRCTVAQLAAELTSGPIRGSAPFRTARAEVSDGIRSAAEADLRTLLLRGRLPKPLFNPRLFVGPELIAIPDAWWPAQGVAAEVDSRQWHLSPADWEQTMRRPGRMTALGIHVLHFSPRVIRSESAEVLRTIAATLASAGTRRLPVRTVPAAP